MSICWYEIDARGRRIYKPKQKSILRRIKRRLERGRK